MIDQRRAADIIRSHRAAYGTPISVHMTFEERAWAWDRMQDLRTKSTSLAQEVLRIAQTPRLVEKLTFTHSNHYRR